MTLPSGSSRGSSVKVQVLLPAPRKSPINKGFIGLFRFHFTCHTVIMGVSRYGDVSADYLTFRKESIKILKYEFVENLYLQD